MREGTHLAALRQLEAACGGDDARRGALRAARLVQRRTATLVAEAVGGSVAAPSAFSRAMLAVAHFGWAPIVVRATSPQAGSYAHSLGMRFTFGLPELLVTAPPAATRVMAALAAHVLRCGADEAARPAVRAALARGEGFEFLAPDVLRELAAEALECDAEAPPLKTVLDAARRVVWRFRVLTPGGEGDELGGLMFQQTAASPPAAAPRRFAAAASRAPRFWALMEPEAAAPEQLPQLHCDVGACCAAAAAPELLPALHALTFVDLEDLDDSDPVDEDWGTGEEALEAELLAAERKHSIGPFECACLECDDAAARRVGLMCAAPGCRAAGREGPARLQRCSGCAGRAVYCGREHQAADWARHKPECKRWRTA